MNDKKSFQEYRVGDFHSEAWVFDHVVGGLICGYSECCIKYSLLRRHCDPSCCDTGVILCPECADVVLVDTIYERIRAVRLINMPFPYDGILSDDDISNVTPTRESKIKAKRIFSELIATLIIENEA